jgi:hypothetical protein
MNTVMNAANRIDEYGKGAWIALTVLGFIICWPVGLAMLVFLIWSGRMRCSRDWRMHDKWCQWSSDNRREQGGSSGYGRGSGNSAFEEYRAETLRRLEDEQDEFLEFLQRLRHARDKEEFDEFMRARRKPTTTNENRDEKEPSSEPKQ